MDSLTYTPDNLIAGDMHRTTEQVTLTGSDFLRGTVLGKITSGGKCVKVNSTGTDDGRRTPYAVLAEDSEASSADTVAIAYLTGEFAQEELIFGGTDTYATHKSGLRDIGIFVKETTEVA